MKVYFLKTDTSQYVIYPVPEDESLYFSLDVESDDELAQKTPVLHKGKLVLVDKQPSAAHELNLDTLTWEISSEKQTALLTQQKKGLLNKLADKVDQLKNSLLAGYPQTEIESFYRQEKEALAWTADKNADTPMLKQVARVRGIPFDVLVERVIEKASQFAVAIGVIIGQRQAFEDRLLTLKTTEELTALEKEIEEWKFQAN